MIFDLFHSLSDPIVMGRRQGPVRCLTNFLAQARLAEELGVDTVWCAESHFSSEVQKKTSLATIPHFQGEVGLNSDSFQLFHWLAAGTNRNIAAELAYDMVMDQTFALVLAGFHVGNEPVIG